MRYITSPGQGPPDLTPAFLLREESTKEMSMGSERSDSRLKPKFPRLALMKRRREIDDFLHRLEDHGTDFYVFDLEG